MESHKSISPTEFRLFFNRFAIETDGLWEIRIPNYPEFQMTANLAGKQLAIALKEPLLTPVQRCRLLDDLGILSLIIAFENDQEKARVDHLAISIQKIFLEKNGVSPCDVWKESARLHPLVHAFATHWRAVPFGPPSPLLLTSEDKITQYLLQIAEKTPQVVDKARIEAVKEFLDTPVIVKNLETTKRLQNAFSSFWFNKGNILPKIVDVPQQYQLHKLVPDMAFGEITKRGQ